MTFRFDFEKSLQAAGCLLELHGDRMEYVRDTVFGTWVSKHRDTIG
jgi:hypothetical protein